MLSLLIFSLCTNDCVSKKPAMKILKFADDTTVVSLIAKEGLQKGRQTQISPPNFSVSVVFIVEPLKFLGATISRDWERNTVSIAKRTQQRMFFLRQLKTFNLPDDPVLHSDHRVHLHINHKHLVWFLHLTRTSQTPAHNKSLFAFLVCSVCYMSYMCSLTKTNSLYWRNKVILILFLNNYDLWVIC